MNKKLSDKGFTLVEILIVISIISILFMILIPQVNGYFIKANETGIRTDFHEFQLASETYFRESLGVDTQLESLNNHLDATHKISAIGAIYQTKSKDPWGNAYEVGIETQKVTFSSYGKDENPSVKKYSITSYYHKGSIDSCTFGFATGNIELAKIKNLPEDFVCGSDISEIIPQPPTGSLDAPTNFRTTFVGQTSAELAWNSIAGATSYILKKDGVAIYTGNNITYSDITLDADTTYTYSVAARNATDASAYVTLSVKTNSIPIPPTPLAPTNFIASNVRDTTVDLTWDSMVNATEYIVKRDGILVYTGNNTTFSDVGLTAGTTYVYTVASKNIANTSEETLLNVKMSSPAPSESSENIHSISAGYGHTVALKNDGTVWAWGNNTRGELGDGTTTERKLPVQVKNLSDMNSISGVGYSTIALKNDGTVWAWGYNFDGQLGDGTTTNRNTPVQVKDLSNVISISKGNQHSMALKDDGTVWTWGFNKGGQDSGSFSKNQLTPLQVNNLTDVKMIAGGNIFTLALKNDGTVWAWGQNHSGQLGDGTYNNKNLPVQVNNLTDVKMIAAGGSQTIALKNNGTVWRISGSSPAQVNNLSNVKGISVGSNYSIALKNDGTVWAWGNNNTGKLGDGTRNNSNSPVQVKNLTDVKSVSAGNEHTLALKNDGTVWAWGSNFAGQLGNGTSNSSYVPTQVKNANGVGYFIQ